MNNKIYLLTPVLFLAACASAPQEPTYEWIDLTQSDVSDTEYWLTEHRVAPQYTAQAARNGYAGCVEMAFLISPQGQAENIEVIRSFPGKVFDESGKEALRQWRWVPTAANSNNQAVKTTVKLDYTVEGVTNLAEVQQACDSDLRQFFS